MKNNELIGKLEELISGIPANTAVDAIDHLLQSVAMGSAKRAKAIVAKIQELEEALKAEEELYLSTMNRLPGDPPPHTSFATGITGSNDPAYGKHVRVESAPITVGDILTVICNTQRVMLVIDDKGECNVSDKSKIRDAFLPLVVIDVSTHIYGGSSIMIIQSKTHAQ